MTRETTATETAIDVELLVKRIAELEAQVKANTGKSNATREVCARGHAITEWKVTPKGVRYCRSCYKEMRLEQAIKKARELGMINE